LSLIEKAKAKGVNLALPTDAMCADKFANDANTKVAAINAIEDGWMGLDIAADTIKNYKEIILSSKVILWNGPMGVFEMEKFAKGTIEVANALVAATEKGAFTLSEKGAFTLVGGGDSVAAINQFNLADKVSYVSTGGGAMLEALEGIGLPGIAAIKQ